MDERTKELAEQAGLFWTFSPAYEKCLERFAELVRQDEREHIKQENQRCYVGSEKYRSQK